ncbi:MAG: RecB family exonuclease [Microthrixaceae bacterium]
MALPLPSTLSPSKVSSFTSCALAFRFSSIDRLPEEPSAPAVKGTTVHRALELLFVDDPDRRTPERGQECLQVALAEMADDADYIGLQLDEAGEAAFRADTSKMVDRYFTLEDPTAIRPIGLELMLTAELGSLTVRGIIDRLELDADGELVVTDYKTGRAPSKGQEGSRLGGVHFYSMLCEQVLGRRPSKVQLIYLGNQPQIITTTTSEQSNRGVERKVQAVWSAIERACDTEDFRPHPGPLCSWCSFKEFCPSFGGDPALAAAAGDAARS